MCILFIRPSLNFGHFYFFDFGYGDNFSLFIFIGIIVAKGELLVVLIDFLQK